jgi:hypothetical protein
MRKDYFCRTASRKRGLFIQIFSFFPQGNQFFLREDEESLQLESISQRGGKRGG